MNYTTSKELIKNTKHFIDIKKFTFFSDIKNATFYGWGRKASGDKAVRLAKKYNQKYVLLEDGFIRSVGLSDTPSFSIINDKVGIYYDANSKSELENILNYYNFSDEILNKAKMAIELIKKHNISKYNHAKNVSDDFFAKDEKRVLVIAQTKNDASLKFGLANGFSTNKMLQDALKENPNSTIYLKLHPEVISGKKESDILPSEVPSHVKIISDDFNPISLLKNFKKVYTKTSQMGFEALILGIECVCYGMPFYAGWGVSIDKISCQRRLKKRSVLEIFAAAYILYTRYKDPYTKQNLDIIGVINAIVVKKEKLSKRAYLFGFSRWKHDFVRPFLKEFDELMFINPLFGTHIKLALKRGLNHHSKIFFWGSKTFKGFEKFYNIIRVEDGFLRSVGLGSDLMQPYSLVFDDLGIYFDPRTQSRLEKILNEYNFSNELLKEARELKDKIVNTKISKYNQEKYIELNIDTDRKKILVIGQVQDDASVLLGASGVTNLDFLNMVRVNNKEAFVIYKPHPDVESGNRVGKISNKQTKELCDLVLEQTNIISAIIYSDEVHTLSSLSGFEALLYEKKVVCYGMPFYAGWGLTEDKQICNRRKRAISIDEMVAAVYILYPKYINPKTLSLCSANTLIDEILILKQNKNSSNSYKLKRYFIRKIQFLVRLFK